LDRIGQQLQLIYNLQKKHQVATIDELLEIQQLENSVLNSEI
jgi:DNA repair protein RecN (Recombination protein N)